MSWTGGGEGGVASGGPGRDVSDLFGAKVRKSARKQDREQKKALKSIMKGRKKHD